MDFNIRRTFAYILSIIISGGFFMPKNKFQEVIFTIMMVLVMVYAMICYNIALATGGLTNVIFAAAFRELLFMAPLAFLLDFFLFRKLHLKRRTGSSM